MNNKSFYRVSSLRFGKPDSASAQGVNGQVHPHPSNHPLCKGTHFSHSGKVPHNRFYVFFTVSA